MIIMILLEYCFVLKKYVTHSNVRIVKGENDNQVTLQLRIIVTGLEANTINVISDGKCCWSRQEFGRRNA